MIQTSFPTFKTILGVALTIILIEGRAQHLPNLSFSSISISPTGSCWLSQPFSAFFQSDCMWLHMGLGLHYAEKRHGVFEVDCWKQDSLSEIQFLLYPNPVHSTATLSILSQGAFNHKIQLQWVDAQGRTVKTQRVTMQDLYPGFSIDMSSFSSGVYFLRIVSSAFNSAIKIIKI